MLKNLPLGLLCDLYQPELPWKLELGLGNSYDIHDTFINSVKEVSLCCLSVPETQVPREISDLKTRLILYAMGRRRGSCRCPRKILHGCGIRFKTVRPPSVCCFMF